MRWVRRHLLTGWAIVVYLYLFLPIFVIVLFSFNKPRGNFNFTWQEFSLDAWRDPFAVEGIKEALFASLRIAFLSTLIATLLGTLVAFAMTRYRFGGRGFIDILLILPMATPELVLGSSLLTLILSSGQNTGLLATVIAHVMFSLSYVAITVRARLRGFNWTLEDAAADLGASPMFAFRKVTLPLMLPGVIGGALLAFAISLDDFIITLFTSGTELQTFPKFVWTQSQKRLPPQLNVISTWLLLATIAIGAGALILQRRRERALLGM
jgi:spermidine/putrescine transport system permease protein